MKHKDLEQTDRDVSLATKLESIYGATVKRKVTEWKNIWSKIVKRKQGISYLSHCLKNNKIPNGFHKNYICRSVLTRKLKFELEYELVKEEIKIKKDDCIQNFFKKVLYAFRSKNFESFYNNLLIDTIIRERINQF